MVNSKLAGPVGPSTTPSLPTFGAAQLRRQCLQIAGASHDDFVYTSFTNEALGATPYIILLDR